MKKSAYRKVMLLLSITNLIILLVIANKIEVFSGLSTSLFIKIIISILNNSYVCSILCSILAVIIIYCVQVRYSKMMLKRDFRCNEIIQDICFGIKEYNKLRDKIPQDKENVRDKNTLLYYKFYCENIANIYTINLSLSYENNDLLLESVQSCFFINLNFRLLNIINNIKNRLPNLRKRYPEIESLCQECKLDEDKQKMKKIDNILSNYFLDLQFMVDYWNLLLDYLDYDYVFVEKLTERYRMYNSKKKGDVNQTPEEFRKSAKEIYKLTKRDVNKNKWKHFWDR